MKTLTNIICGLMLTAVLFSCKKNDEITPLTPTLSNCNLKKISYSPKVGHTIVYDGIICVGDQITQILSHKYFYTYDSSGHIIRQEIRYTAPDLIDESHTYRPSWNLRPFMQSIDSSFYDGLLRPIGFTGYFYSGAFYKSELDLFKSTSSIVSNNNVEYTWEHGDPTIAIMTEPNNNQMVIDQITYDTTKINKFNQTFPYFIFLNLDSNDDYTNQYFQYHYLSKHIIVGITSTSQYRQTGNYTYTYNAQDLIKEVKLNGRSIVKYEYTCD